MTLKREITTDIDESSEKSRHFNTYQTMNTFLEIYKISKLENKN